jgi:hypothetical protein
MHTLRQTPCALLSDVHDGGTYVSPDAMNLSGTQKPPGHGARFGWLEAGTNWPGAQCAFPVVQQLGSEVGSTRGRGVPVHVDDPSPPTLALPSIAVVAGS